MEFGLIDTSGMSEQQRREIAYTVVKTPGIPQGLPPPNNLRLNDVDVTSPPRYDDLKKTSTHFNHSPIDDETGSVVIV